MATQSRSGAIHTGVTRQDAPYSHRRGRSLLRLVPLAPKGDTRRETNSRCVQEAPLSYLFEPPRNLKLAPEMLYGQTRGTDLAVKRPELRRLLIGNWPTRSGSLRLRSGRHEGLKTHCTGVRSRWPRLKENRSFGFSAPKVAGSNHPSKRPLTPPLQRG